MVVGFFRNGIVVFSHRKGVVVVMCSATTKVMVVVFLQHEEWL